MQKPNLKLKKKTIIVYLSEPILSFECILQHI